MKTSPTLSLPTKLPPCRGNTEKTMRAGTRNTMGAKLKTGRSAPSGTVSSLEISLTKVGNRLEQAERTPPIRPQPRLEPAQRSALKPSVKGGGEYQGIEDYGPRVSAP